MSAYDCRSFVVCRLEADDRETPLGTLWCEGWGDAIATARTLYEGPLLVRGSADSPAVSNLWLDAYDREAEATHAENEAMERMALLLKRERRILTALEKLFPHLYRERQ